MILQVLYVICCFCLTWELWRRRSKKSTSSPPALSGRLPLIGHGWKVLGDRKHAFNTLKWMSEETLEKGGVAVLHLGPRKLYLLTNPDDCAIVANACLDKGYYYNFAKPFLGNGLIIADVPLWKQHRKYMSPIFRQQVLNDFLVVFNHQAKRLVNQFKPEIGKGSFNHEEYIRLNSLESICMTAYGADVSDFGELYKDFLEGLNEILDIFTERFQKFWMHTDFIYNRSNLRKRQDIVIKNIRKFTGLIIEKRKTEIVENTSTLDKSGRFTPFMNLLFDVSKETGCYSEDHILSETNTIIGAGYDTSSCTNTLVLMLLGSHPEVQMKAYEELLNIFGNSDRNVEKEDLPKLVYLEAVIKETLRLYPVGPIVARYIAKDVQLKNYTLKAGCSVAMVFWAMHRHPVWSPEVEQFRPERWLDGSLPRNSNAFGAFSLGKRGCIGKNYAMMSMKTVLSHILRRYIITSDISKLELEIDTILKPASGQNISIEERKQTLT